VCVCVCVGSGLMRYVHGEGFQGGNYKDERECIGYNSKTEKKDEGAWKKWQLPTNADLWGKIEKR
jgi:hypothetical protein